MPQITRGSLAVKRDSDGHAPLESVFTGRELAREIRKLGAVGRALLARGLTTGAVRVIEFTPRQTCLLTRASVGYCATARAVSASDARAIRWGQASLAQFHVLRRQVLRRVSVDEAVAGWRTWTSEQRAEFGRSAGVAEVWDDAIAPVVDEERGESQLAQVTD